VDSSWISFLDHAHAPVNAAAGGVHYVPVGAGFVLAKHLRSWRDALLELGLCDTRGADQQDTPGEVRGSICRRIVIAQSLYAAGAALCFINTWVSIAAIVLVQLNYAIAPHYAIAPRWSRK